MQPEIPKKPPTKNLMFFLGVIVIISLMATFAVNAAFTVTDGIYDGVKVGDIDVGSLSVQAAEAKIAATFQERMQQPPITLTYQNQAWSISANDVGLSIDAAELAKQAYAVGRTGNIFYRMQERYLTINQGHTVPMTPVVDSTKLLARLTAIAKTIDKEPRNAAVTLSHSAVTVADESVGYKTDIAKTMASITSQLSARIPCTIAIAVDEVDPLLFARDLHDVDGVLASYTTQFDPSDRNRTQNISLATKNVNGVLIRKDEVFSFNAHVGPRLAQYGYKEAPVFINGKLLPDWGGGVCQVSSTLYNAALLADLTIMERTSHFRPPGYVPLGQDATVADNLLDFKFKNTGSSNIYVLADLGYGRLTIHLLGKQKASPLDIAVVATEKKVLEPNIVVKQDPQLELGKEVVEVEGQKGFQVTTYRIKYTNGREVDREFLANDEFVPEDRIVRVEIGRAHV